MNKAQIKSLISHETKIFYVYMLSRPNGSPFYIGKGQKNRIFQHEKEAQTQALSYKLNIIRKIDQSHEEIDYQILDFFANEEDCFQKEIDEILRLGRYDLKTGPLANLTDGGEGASGISEETKRKIDEKFHGPNAPGERGIANRFFLQLSQDSASVPIKPVSEFSPKPLAEKSSQVKPSARMAAALAGSAIANRIFLKTGCIIPRHMSINGTSMCIENGASKNLIDAGMATLETNQIPGHENFILTTAGYAAILQFINIELLTSAGVTFL
jgi:hypothetical protein